MASRGDVPLGPPSPKLPPAIPLSSGPVPPDASKLPVSPPAPPFPELPAAEPPLPPDPVPTPDPLDAPLLPAVPDDVLLLGWLVESVPLLHASAAKARTSAARRSFSIVISRECSEQALSAHKNEFEDRPSHEGIAENGMYAKSSRCCLALLRQILAMTDHDQQLPRVAHTKYGEAVGGGASDRNRRWASPLGLRRQLVLPVRSVLEWAYGYSDETIW